MNNNNNNNISNNNNFNNIGNNLFGKKINIFFIYSSFVIFFN